MYRKEFGPTPNYNAQSAQLTEARKDSWLKEGCYNVQQQALRDLDQSFKNWWKNPSHYGPPTWRKAGQHEGFRITGLTNNQFVRLSRKRAQVQVPKIGWVAWRWTRNPGTAKSYRITRDKANRWWIAFAIIPQPTSAPGNGKIVGIDRGCSQSFVTSDGVMLKIPGLSLKEKERLLRLKRQLARQQKSSKGRARTKSLINRLEQRNVAISRDAVEKFTTYIASNYDKIRIEKLKTVNMTKSAKGTINIPGINVRAKTELNREILSNRWGFGARRLEDKARGRVEKVNPYNTSIKCSNCGYTDKKNRKSQAVFKCGSGSCKYKDNADVNAAKNIAAGYAVSARRDLILVRSLKREPQLSLTR
jgi:putative transposase